MNQNKNKGELKIFFIKLTAIVLSIIIIINVSYNLIFADKLDALNKVIMLNEKENIDALKDKVRLEINNGLKKDRILKDEDAQLL